MNIEMVRHIYFRIPVLIRLLLTILLVMVLFGVLIHFIEPNQFPTFFDGIWWAFVTGATVGYGDYVPLSSVGRMIGILLMLTGAGLMTFYISLFAASTIKYERDLSEGIIAYKGSGHLLCIGWNERTRKLIEMALKKNPQLEIVLIDQSLKHLSYQHYPIHYIHGDPTEDITLNKAKLTDADQVIITADLTQSEQQADKYTILSTVAMRGNNETVPIIVEILTKKQIQNAKRAGATTIIRPNDFMSILLYHELFRSHQAHPFESILYLLTEQKFIQMKVPVSLENHSFFDSVSHFKDQGCLIIGLVRNDDWIINPLHDFSLKENDSLIGIKSWEYEK